MNYYLEEDTFEQIFFSIKSRLRTGVDRINVSNFESNLSENLNIIVNKLNNNKYTFATFKEVTIGKRQISIPTIRDRIVIEYLKNIIKMKYNIRIKNRDEIISNINNIISEDIDYYVIRLDIKEFFKSIPLSKLYEKIENSSLLNLSEYKLIRQLLDNSKSGVIEGISISNLLSELYMEIFDIKMKKIHSRILFYSRYVDDIIIIITGNLSNSEKNKIKFEIQAIFSDFEFEFNIKKCASIQLLHGVVSNGFDYLGYNFRRIIDGKKSSLQINISSNKIQKYYNKINKIFYMYYKTSNFELLYDQLNALIYRHKIFKYIYSIDEVNYYMIVNYGLPIQYMFAGDASYDAIDNFIKRKIYKLIQKVKLAREERDRLYSISAKKVKNGNQIIIYSKIPITTLRKKVHRYSFKKIKYKVILRMSKDELIGKYYDLVNIKI